MSPQLHLVAVEGTAWPLGAAEFARVARMRWPDAVIDTDPVATIATPHVTFDIEIDQMARYGMYVQAEQLVLNAGSPEDWADTVVWFLGLLPRGSGVECFTDAAPVPHALPTGATAEQVVEVFREVDASF